jgi:reactive intermediate/imine deaminase
MNRRSNLADVPAPAGGYSQVVEAAGLLFTAGMGPGDPATGEIVGTTIEEQTAQTLDNLEAVLRACGAGFDAVVRASVHLADVERDFRGFDAEFARRFAHHLPARTTVGAKLAGILVEIDLVAVKASGAAV